MVGNLSNFSVSGKNSTLPDLQGFMKRTYAAVGFGNYVQSHREFLTVCYLSLMLLPSYPHTL